MDARLHDNTSKGAIVDKNERFKQAALVLTAQNERMGMQIIALTAMNATLLREICVLRQDPLDYLGKLEAELGGVSEAIASTVSGADDFEVSTVEITATIEQVLRLCRDQLTRRPKA